MRYSRTSFRSRVSSSRSAAVSPVLPFVRSAARLLDSVAQRRFGQAQIARCRRDRLALIQTILKTRRLGVVLPRCVRSRTSTLVSDVANSQMLTEISDSPSTGHPALDGSPTPRRTVFWVYPSARAVVLGVQYAPDAAPHQVLEGFAIETGVGVGAIEVLRGERHVHVCGGHARGGVQWRTAGTPTRTIVIWWSGRDARLSHGSVRWLAVSLSLFCPIGDCVGRRLNPTVPGRLTHYLTHWGIDMERKSWTPLEGFI